jgi:hypothetical protein
MRATRWLSHTMLGLGAAGAIACGGAAPAAPAAPDATLRTDLEAVAERRVFFAHQSVGGNVLDGVRLLAARAGVDVRIAEAQPGGVPARTLAHALVGSNQDPRSKLRGFAEAFATGAAANADLALVKLCYVDFDAASDAAALFAQYQATLAALRARHPATTFVHVTAPLVAVPGGIAQSLKQLLGRPAPRQAAENARREEYNALLRGAYAGREPVFDLARVESTRPDGAAETTEWQRRAVPSLVAGYTTDGGHLSDDGRARAARELVAVLAAAARPGSASR